MKCFAQCLRVMAAGSLGIALAWTPAAAHWTQRDNRWQLERGHWNKGDRDHDWVPNAVDRAPENPNRQ